MDRMLRPKVRVLSDAELVEKQGTYTVTGEQPYFLKKPRPSSQPAGTLPAGSKVTLVSKGPGDLCLIDDAEGRRIYVPFAGLQSAK